MQPNITPEAALFAEANPASVVANANASANASPSERATQGGHIFFKAEDGVLYLHLPPSTVVSVEWSQLWEQLQHRLGSSQRIWPPNTPVHLVAHDRLLDQRQLEQLTDALTAAHLYLKQVLTSRRQTAISAVTIGCSVEMPSPTLNLANAAAVDNSPMGKLTAPSSPTPVLAEPLYLQTTLRSGGEVRHPGTVVIQGDINPGSSVIADGDILVWGRLRGIAHAGANGDRNCHIMALQMEPTQLRIADQVARAPAKSPAQFYPEVASIGPEGIRITRASEVNKRQSPSGLNA